MLSGARRSIAQICRNFVRGALSSTGGAANGGSDSSVSKSALSFVDPKFVGSLVLLWLGAVGDRLFLARGLLDTKRDKEVENIAESLKDLDAKRGKDVESITGSMKELGFAINKQSERIDRIFELLLRGGGGGGGGGDGDGGGVGGPSRKDSGGGRT
eukprot:tig00000241_g21013.t1